ncbi:hypothetical protein [Streptomyces sp. NPDC059881]|uniref:hypothetical protein n=1 Tax=Streptomyces sp. NPDC059881 TaxID=3346986 RepID=UPI00366599A1
MLSSFPHTGVEVQHRRQKWKKLPENTSEPQRQLVTAMRELRDCSPRTQAEIARDAGQAPTSLSNHLNGGRIPEEQLLRCFYKVVEGDAAEAGIPLPHALEVLQDLRVQALVKHCQCCLAGRPDSAPEMILPTPAEMPASVSVRHMPGRLRVRRYSRLGPIRTLPERKEVPVPPSEGDRHPVERADETWSELETVMRHLVNGQRRDAAMILWAAGTTLPALDVQIAVAACRAAGMHEAADAVLTSAGERDAQAVLNIAAALHNAHQYADAAVMLNAAAQPEG